MSGYKKGDNSSMTDGALAAMTGPLLHAAGELSDDPYAQMAALKAAASIIEHRLGSYALKAGITAALTNALNHQH